MKYKKYLSMFLAGAMVLSSAPVSVIAEGTDNIKEVGEMEDNEDEEDETTEEGEDEEDQTTEEGEDEEDETTEEGEDEEDQTTEEGEDEKDETTEEGAVSNGNNGSAGSGVVIDETMPVPEAQVVNLSAAAIPMLMSLDAEVGAEITPDGTETNNTFANNAEVQIALSLKLEEETEDEYKIFYTTDLSEPTSDGTRTEYTEAFTVRTEKTEGETITIKYVAAKEDPENEGAYIYSEVGTTTIVFSAAEDEKKEEEQPEESEQTLTDGTYSVPLVFNYYYNDSMVDYATGKPNRLIQTPGTVEVKDGKMTVTMKAAADGADYVTGFQYRLQGEDTFTDAEVKDTDEDGNADEISFTIDYTEDYLVTRVYYPSIETGFESALCLNFANAEQVEEEQPEESEQTLADGTYSVPLVFNYYYNDSMVDYATGKPNRLIQTPGTVEVKGGKMTVTMKAVADGTDYVTGFQYRLQGEDTFTDAEVKDTDGDDNADEISFTIDYTEDYLVTRVYYPSIETGFESALCMDFANATKAGGETEPETPPAEEYGDATHTIWLVGTDPYQKDGKKYYAQDIIKMPEELEEKGVSTGSMFIETAAGDYLQEAELIEEDGNYTLRFRMQTVVMGFEFKEIHLVDVDLDNFENQTSTAIPLEKTTYKGQTVYEFYIPIGPKENLGNPIFMWSLNDTPFGDYWGPSMITPQTDYLIDLSEDALPEDGTYLVDLKKDVVSSAYQDMILSYENVPVVVKDGEATIQLKVSNAYKANTGNVYYAVYGKDTSYVTCTASSVPVSGEAANYIFLKTNDLRRVIITNKYVSANLDNRGAVIGLDLETMQKNENPETFDFLEDGNYTAEIEILDADGQQNEALAAYFETTGVPLKSENGKMTLSLRMTQNGLDAFQQNFYGKYTDIAVTPISGTDLNMVDVTLYYKGDTAILQAANGSTTVDFKVRLKEDTIQKIGETSLLVDGSYTVDIACLKDTSNDESMSARYFEQEDVPIEVKDGKIYMTVTIKTEAEGMKDLVQGLKYRLNGKWIDANPQDAGEFEDGIDRVTAQIQVASLEEPVYVQIYVTAMGYWATLRLVPDLNTLEAVGETDLSDMLAVPEVSTNPSTYTGMFPNDETIMVTLTTEEENADIYYTVDGSAPVVGTAKTFKYTKPFAVTSASTEMNTITVKAITYKDGGKSFAKSYDVIFLAEETEVPVTATEAGVYSVPYRIWKAFENDYSMADDVIDGNMIVQVSEDESGNKTSTYYMSLNARNQNNIIGHLRQLWNIPGTDAPTGSPADYELDAEKAAVLKTVNEIGLNGTAQDYPKLLMFDRDGAGEGYFYIRVDVDAMGDDHQSAKIVLDWASAERAALPDGRYAVDYRIWKAFENDYSMADDAVDGPAEVEIRDGNAIYTLKMKARDQSGIIGHLLQLWNIPGTDAPTGSPADYEVDDQKAVITEYVNEVGLDGTKKDYPRVFEFTRTTTGETYFYVRVDVDAMGESHQSAKFVPDWSTATWLGENKDDIFIAAPVIAPEKTSAGNNETVSVQITEATTGAVVYYTTDGSEPTTASAQYNGAFQVTGSNTTVTIKAIAVMDGNTSAISSASVKFASSSSVGGDTAEIEDGKYWMNFNLWHAYANQASMGNVAFENNRKALVTVQDGVATIEVGTNPVSVSGYTSALKDLRSDEVDIEILSTSSFTTNTKYDGEAHTFDYITKFTFTIDDLDTEYVDVEISVPYTPMDGISENVGGWIAARFKLDFDNMTDASDNATLKPSSSAASGSSSASGDAVDTADSKTGVKIGADAFVFENGTEFDVSYVTTGSKYTAAQNAVGADHTGFVLYNITATCDDEEVNPSGQVEISFPVVKDVSADQVKIYRVVNADHPADAYKTELEFTLSEDGNFYVIKVKELGLYAIVYDTAGQTTGGTDSVSGDMTAPAVTSGFADMAGHWAANIVQKAVAMGIMSGISQTEFAPNLNTTRGMFVTALGRMDGVESGMYQGNKYTDVMEKDYFYSYVAWATATGVVHGVSETQFAPNATITREQMAVILYNYVKSKGITLINERGLIAFTDDTNISSYAKEAVEAIVRAGIMSGRTNGSFDPKGLATRAEMATVLVNFADKYMNESKA